MPRIPLCLRDHDCRAAIVSAEMEGSRGWGMSVLTELPLVCRAPRPKPQEAPPSLAMENRSQRLLRQREGALPFLTDVLPQDQGPSRVSFLGNWTGAESSILRLLH